MSERPKYPVEARKLLRSTLLDAVHHLLKDRTWPDVTMAAIAKDAGVSRQTVYNEFGGREGIAQAYVLREAQWFVTAAQEAVAAHADDPHAALRASFAHFLSAASEHPVLRAIAGGEHADELLALLTTHGEPVVSTASATLAACISETWPQIRIDQARMLADTLVRLAISHAALPGGAPAETVAKVLGPYIDQLLHGRTSPDVIAV